MAAVGVMAAPVPTQLVQYANDAVDVYYSDGSRLQLSACGTAFRYYHPPYAGQHPLHGQKEIQQRTEFVTSEFRAKVKEALEFRNRFAERPFLCRGLLQKGNIVCLHADIAEVAWPSSIDEASIAVLPDGSLRLVSADEYAAVTLAPHRQYVTTEVLSKVSQRRQRSTGPRHNNPLQRSSHIPDAMPSPIPRVPPSHNIQHIEKAGQPEEHNHSEPFTCQPHTSRTNADPIPRASCTESFVATEENKGQGLSDTHTAGDAGSDGKWDYVWISQHHSLADYPNTWRHPVELLIEFLDIHPDMKSPGCTNPNDSDKNVADSDPKTGEQSDANGHENPLDLSVLQEKVSSMLSKPNSGVNRGESAQSTTERRAVTLQRLLKKDFAGCVFVPTPKSLPLNCPSLHLHRWRPEVITSDDNDRAEAAYMYGKVKVICAQGIIYKLVWQNPRGVEIYPGDGSLMRSTGLSGHFFTHFITRPNQIEERTYSTQSPPPTVPGTPYSVAKLVTRAARFLKHLCEESLHSLLHEDPCCWAVLPSQSDPVDPVPTVLLEDCLLEGVGHFTAYSNGHIRVLFGDRTSLDMICDFTKRVLGDNPDHETLKRYARRPRPLGLSTGIARLLLRTGHYHNVDVNSPEQYEPYVKAALHWARWVNSSPTERGQFYKDTIYDLDKQRSVEAELKKIKCFNYIVENVTTKTYAPGPRHVRPHTPHGPTPHSPHSPSPHTLRGPTLHNPHGPTTHDITSTTAASPGHMVHVSANQSREPLNMASIQDVLRQTAAAVADLDQFMRNAVNTKVDQR